MFTIKFKAIDSNNKAVRFNVKEPVSSDAYKNAYDRALKIANHKGWRTVTYA